MTPRQLGAVLLSASALALSLRAPTLKGSAYVEIAPALKGPAYQAPRPQAPAPSIDTDDIGGTVTSDEGPEAGVWVVAETVDLPTGFVRIVVTDDQGRFVVPDLPRAGFDLFVRGYGLIDSARVPARPGHRIDLKVVRASSEREAALVYPASYWLTVMRVPPTGPIHPADLTRTMKGCMECHQLGSKATRELPAAAATPASHLDAWDERMKRVSAHAAALDGFARLRGQRTMFSEWTERVGKGVYPLAEPQRPAGVERNLVVTLWDWNGASSAGASSPLDARIQPGGRVYGPAQDRAALAWIDPINHTTGEIRLPAAPSSATIDRLGRIWLTTGDRPTDKQPAFCSDPANPFARFFPLESGGSQLAHVDAKAAARSVATCFGVESSDLAADGRLYIGGAGVVGWIDTATTALGWCPMVIDANGDQTITPGWTEPAQPADRTRDQRLNFPCRRIASAGDGTVWCGAGGVNEERIVRVEIGANPPESCRTEIYHAPPWRDVAAARAVAVDDAGVVWVAMAGTDHLASFDRRLCTDRRASATAAQQCAEGWRFYSIPGPPFSIASPTAGADVVLRGGVAARTTDFIHAVAVDRSDVLGLNEGQAVTWALLSNSDAAAALRPATGEFVTMRVPYPLGFYGRSLSPRIDDPRRGWKGRGLWSAYGSEARSHAEGRAGNKVVKFQVRPDPLAK
jgi:hypothetical protein